MAIIRSNQTAGQYFLLALLLKTYWVLFGLLFCSPFFCFIFVRLLSHLCFTARTFYSGPHCALLAMQTAVIATGCLSVRPFVRPSHSVVLSKRMKIRSYGFQHQVVQSF